MEQRGAALERAHRHAATWLASLDDRPVPPSIDTDEVVRRLGDLPDGPTPAAEVVDLMAEACEPGLVAIPSGRFFGMVIGGTLPAALGADWLTSAWDQNTGLRALTPAAAAVEEVAGRWILDLLGLPGESAVGFVTGATMANFTCLAAARDTVLMRGGHDIRHGLLGGPRVRVLVGAERHPSVDLPLRFLGLGEPDVVPADAQGRILPEALASALAQESGPTIVVLQAGNIHSGDFDPFAECIALAREHDAWVHVDGAFGLWAAVSPRWADDVRGLAEADSWATDAHKTLNVPYDCGLAIVRDRDALASSMAMHGEYLIEASGDPQERVPELSRRGRGFASWAALRSLGRGGRRRDGRGAGCPCAGLRRRGGGDRRRRGAQRRGLHPGLPVVRRRRPHARRRRGTPRRRHHLDVGLALARPRDRADLGEQLEHDRGRRTSLARRPAPRGRVRLTPTSGRVLDRPRARRPLHNSVAAGAGGAVD